MLIALPVSASADVFFSEIAWMGDTVSANNEWIEIYNDGSSSVGLSSWRIVASDGTPDFYLSGSIGARSYKVFYRSGGDYTGALSNSGETLSLKDSSGQTVDSVTSGSNWSSIGGDNNTKETAQYNGSNWFTASPTPGLGNIPHTNTSEESLESNEETNLISSSNETKITANIVASAKRAVVGMPVRFDGHEDAEGSESVSGYNWNFGDGTTGRGLIIHHTYTQPGSYVVFLNYSVKGKKESDSFTVVVLDSVLTISAVNSGPRGFVEINNNSDISADVSGWLLRNSIDRFIFPDGSYVAPNSKLRVDTKVLSLEGMSHLDLVDKAGNVAASYVGQTEIIPNSFYQSKGIVRTSLVSEEKDPFLQNTEDLAAVGLSVDSASEKNDWTWIIYLFSIIVLASGALFLVPQKTKKPMDLVLEDDIQILE